MRTVSGYSSLARRKNSTPVMPGMRWSDSTTSTSYSAMRCSPSAPLLAVTMR